MKSFIKNSAILVLCLHLAFMSMAQTNANFPVNINPVLYPPYPFSVYYINVATKPSVRVIIHNKSSNASIINGLLKVIIKTNNFTAQTKGFDAAYPITLIGNTPLTLTNLDFGSLFRLENLSGITSEQYYNEFQQSTVNISFVLYEEITKRQISQLSTYSYVFSKENPPLLNMPGNDSTFVNEGFPNILFSWIPRQVQPIGSVRYIFEMVESPVSLGMSAPLAFTTYGNNVFFTDSTLSTTYYYSAANPPLRPEFQYSWRIRAVSNDYEGFTNSVFANNGYSAPFKLYYSDPCVLPTGIRVVPDYYGIDISWQKLSNRQSLTFYGQKTSSDAYRDSHSSSRTPNVESSQLSREDNTSLVGWTNYGTATSGSGESFRINNLDSNATYRIKWKAECSTPANHHLEPILFSTVSTMSTRDPDSTVKEFAAAQARINVVCGQLSQDVTLSQSLLSALSENDQIFAGDFPVIIKSAVKISDGVFSGTGVINMWMGKVFQAKVKFENIKINQDKKLIDGFIKLVSPL